MMNFSLYFFILLFAFQITHANAETEGGEPDNSNVVETTDELIVSDINNDTILTNITENEAKAPRTSPKKMTCLPHKGLNQTVILSKIMIKEVN